MGFLDGIIGAVTGGLAGGGSSGGSSSSPTPPPQPKKVTDAYGHPFVTVKGTDGSYVALNNQSSPLGDKEFLIWVAVAGVALFIIWRK